jgi:hypothetical protein
VVSQCACAVSIRWRRALTAALAGSESLISGGVNTRYGTQVAGIERVGDEWVLYDKDRAELGKFEWCVFTSHTVGHKRWEQVFGFAPPLEALAAKETQLKPVMDPLGSVSSEPIMVAMLAFTGEAEKRSVMQLDFDIAYGNRVRESARARETETENGRVFLRLRQRQ